MNVVLWEALGIFTCLVGSAFFSSSETALTSLSTVQTSQLVEEQEARALTLWQEHPIKVLTSILIGNNMLNITASALATDLANRVLRGTSASDWAIPVAIGGMTFLLLTFGEITPKAIAQRMYMRMSAPMMSMLRLPYFLFYPFTLAFAAMTQGIIRFFGDDLNEREPTVTAEEIEYMIDVGSREGSFSEDHERMLRSVFEFNDTLVREVMVPRTDMVVLNNEMPFEEILDVVQSCGHSRIPVYEERVDNILGIFYVKDLIPLWVKQEGEQVSLKKMLRKPLIISSFRRISDLFTQFKRHRVHMALVVDEFGGVMGLITLEDILEEFFGEIQDEHDMKSESEDIVILGHDKIRADARLSINRLEDFFDLEISEVAEDYDTLGGFLIAQGGAIPAPGTEVFWQGLAFRIMEADAKRVHLVEIERMAHESLLDDEPTMLVS